jgi:hypothetical protein
MEETLEAILAGLDELARREDDGKAVPRPRPPASAEAVAAAEQARGGSFPEDYRRFLAVHDGWPGFPWGLRLFGTEELTGDTYEGARDTFELSTEDDDEIPEQIADATIIASAVNDASLVLLLDSGEVVDFLYEEELRHRDLGDFLAGRLASVRECLAQWDEHESAARADWDPERRAAGEADLLDALRRAGPRSRTGPQTSPAPVPPAGDPANPVLGATDGGPPPAPAAGGLMVADLPPAAVTAGDLVVGDAVPQVSVVLSLVLYLGVYPSPEEVLGCFRAFRRHFPVDGRMSWTLPAEYGRFPREAGHPGDESWAARMRVDGSGHFGIRVSIDAGGTGRTYLLNVRGVPPTGTLPRASFCEVIVPADEDPERLARLATDLTGLLPVRSGHGGYRAQVWRSGHDKVLYQEIYGWCRRFFALGVGHLDGWLTALPTRVLGADWLTVLGPTFAAFLAEHAPARFTAPEVAVTTSPAGTIIRAGDRPTLGDVARGEFPAVLAEIDRYLLPLKIGGWRHTAPMTRFARAWEVTTEELPGGFAEHRATAAWLLRLIEPRGFLDLP